MQNISARNGQHGKSQLKKIVDINFSLIVSEVYKHNLNNKVDLLSQLLAFHER